MRFFVNGLNFNKNETCVALCRGLVPIAFVGDCHTFSAIAPHQEGSPHPCSDENRCEPEFRGAGLGNARLRSKDDPLVIPDNYMAKVNFMCLYIKKAFIPMYLII